MVEDLRFYHQKVLQADLTVPNIKGCTFMRESCSIVEPLSFQLLCCFVFENKRQPDCSYQGKALNVPTAF